MTTPHEANLINKDRKEQAAFLREQLERIGVQVRIQDKTGDSSFPTEYRLRYWRVEAVGPTMDMALVAFMDKLLKYVPVEQEYQDTQKYMEHFYEGGE